MGIDSPPIYVDGLGSRWLTLDEDSGDPVEVLSFAPELVESPEFAGAVGERVARLSRVRHTLYARVRRLDRPQEDALLLFSDRIPGWRLADVLSVTEDHEVSFEIGAVLALLRQLIPAVALFSRHQRDAAIGTIAPERLILTRHGRLVLAEYVLAPGLDVLQYSRERLWREFRVAVPSCATSSRISPGADVVGMGLVALSLLLGRRLRDDEYLFSLGELLDKATETNGGKVRPLSTGFRAWISRALHFDERTAFESAQEAQVAFEEMLAKEQSYVTTAAQLDLFVARLEKTIGPPPSLVPLATTAASLDGPRPPLIDLGGPEQAASVDTQASPAAAKLGEPLVVAPGLSGLRRWLLPAVLVIGLVAILEAAMIGWLTLRLRTTGIGSGELIVQSRPSAARVTVDGEERGVTPATLTLSPGAHVVEVRVGRSEPRVIPVEAKAGVQSTVYVELQSVATVGGLDVRTDSVTARVTVDGQVRGTTPLVVRALPPGDHQVVIEAGGRQVRQTVRIEPGITSQLVVPLAK